MDNGNESDDEDEDTEEVSDSSEDEEGAVPPDNGPGGGGGAPPPPPPGGGAAQGQSRGPRGHRGQRGHRGWTGPQGKRGVKGERGYVGPKGDKGDKGDRGPPGPNTIPIASSTMAHTGVTGTSFISPLNTSNLENSFVSLNRSIQDMIETQQVVNFEMQEIQRENVTAIQRLTETSRQRNYDYLFSDIPIFSGEDKEELEPWLDRLEIACEISNRIGEIRDVALGKTRGSAADTLRSIDKKAPWSLVKDEFRRSYSDNKTRIHSAALLSQIEPQHPGETIRNYLLRFGRLNYQATKRPTMHDYEMPTKVNFLSKLLNKKIAVKVAKTKEFLDYDNCSLQDCFRLVMENEATEMVAEGLNMGRPATVLNIDEGGEHECHDHSCHEHCQINEVSGGDTRAKNNACWKCGEKGHFARECPKSTFDYNLKEDSAGRLNHHYIGSTEVSKQLWSEFLQKAAKAEANQMVWAAKYKKLKDKKSTQDTTATTTTVTTTGTSQRKPKSTAPTIITRPQKPATTAVIPTTNKTATITTGDSSPTVVTRGVKPKGKLKRLPKLMLQILLVL